jgi:hypothetical protein
MIRLIFYNYAFMIINRLKYTLIDINHFIDFLHKYHLQSFSF